MRVTPREFEETRFARYGAVFHRPTSAGRTALDEVLGCAHPEGRIRASLTRLDPQELPLSLPRMERHPFAAQLFVPVSGVRYLAVTALGTDAPDMTTIEAWVIPGDVGIAYGIGIWHVPMIALDGPATFAVLMHRVSPDLDEDWHTLRTPVEVSRLDS